MKEFFLRYGFLCMLGFFILATIIMISPLGAVVRRGFSAAIDGVKNSPVAALFKSNETIDVTTEDMQNFRIVVHSKKETDEWDIYYKYRDSSAIWSDWEMVEAKPERDGKDFIKTQSIKRVEEGVSLQFKATKISAMKPYSIETEVITY